MKKAYRLIAILLVLMLALCACGKEPEPTSIRLPDDMLDGMPETTAPQVENTTPTQPRETQPKETEPEKKGPDYDAYAELLKANGYGPEQNWILQAMSCVFGQPEDIDLYNFFYGTMTGSWDSISEESATYLIGQGYHKDLDLQVRPLEEMENVMQKIFGISLSDVEDGIPSRWRYLAAEKAYVSNHNDSNAPSDFTITWIEEYAGNRIDIFYTINGTYYNTETGEYLKNPDMVLALRQLNDGSYQVLANLVAPTK